MHDALRTAGKYADTITDITLMDSSYSDTHFKDARDWLFTGSPNKTIRIVQSDDQMQRSHHKVPDPADPTKKIDQIGPPHWRDFFGEAALKTAAKTHGMTLDQIARFDPESTDDRGNQTRVLQHTQVMDAKGQMQCDILVMQSDLGHHEIRDNVAVHARRRRRRRRLGPGRLRPPPRRASQRAKRAKRSRSSQVGLDDGPPHSPAQAPPKARASLPAAGSFDGLP